MGKSLMKAHQRRKAKQEARDEATNLVLEQYEEFLRKADITILYTLHEDFGFGKKRCEKFYRQLIANQMRMIDEFRQDKDDDETHYSVMAKRLKEADIDVKAMQDEADKVPIAVGKYEERKKEIERLKSL